MRASAVINIADMRRMARRRLPRAVFDFIDGGAENEVTLRGNEESWSQRLLRPRVLVDADRRDTATEVFGTRVDLPVLLGPTGLTRLVSPRGGERAVARAADAAGTIYVASTAASAPIEDIANETSGPQWFQLYLWNDRAASERLVARAAEAGFHVLCLTVDTAVRGNRERDLRNGFTYPPRLTWRLVRDGVAHPRWTRDLLTTSRIGMANLEPPAVAGRRRVSAASFLTKRIVDPQGVATWESVRWIRDVWEGPLLIKGVVTAEAAARAVDEGFDGVIVSNHGGRQLDGVLASADALEEVAGRVGAATTVLVDGGIRRGVDVIRALALGATACLIGRPYLYGLGAFGEQGVVRVVDILRSEMDRALALLGVASVREIDGSLLQAPNHRREP